jgi:hypothetical protein
VVHNALLALFHGAGTSIIEIWLTCNFLNTVGQADGVEEGVTSLVMHRRPPGENERIYVTYY